jgi:hypothetical protein
MSTYLKGNSEPVIIKKHMKTYWGSGSIAPPFLTSALDGGEWLASCLCRFTPGEGACGTHWIGGWVGPRVGLDTVEKRKILHCQELNLGHPASSLWLCQLSYPNFDLVTVIEGNTVIVLSLLIVRI